MVKNLSAMRETWVRSLGQEDHLGGGHGNPLQYSCLENLMDREAWWSTVHRATKSQTQLKQLSTNAQGTEYKIFWYFFFINEMMFLKRSDQDGRVRGPCTPLLPQGTPELPLFIEQLSQRTTWRLAENIFRSWRHKEGTTARWVGKAEMQCNQIPHPQRSNSQAGEKSQLQGFSPKSEGPKLQRRLPSLWVLHQEAPRRPGLKVSGACLQQSQKDGKKSWFQEAQAKSDTLWDPPHRQ